MRRMNTASNKMVVVEAIAISLQCADETATGRRTLFLSSSPQCAEETATGRFSLLSLVANIAQTPLFLKLWAVACFLNILIDYSHEHVAVIKVLQASRRFLWITRKPGLAGVHGHAVLSGSETSGMDQGASKFRPDLRLIDMFRPSQFVLVCLIVRPFPISPARLIS